MLTYKYGDRQYRQPMTPHKNRLTCEKCARTLQTLEGFNRHYPQCKGKTQKEESK